MNNKLIFFSLIIVITQAHTMKRKREEPQKLKVQQELVVYTGFPDYASWLPEIKDIIIDFSTNNTIAKKPREATRMINTLARTSTQFNINNPEFSDKLIKNLARKFYCSHETITKFLCTKEATKRLNLQKELKQLCLFDDIFNFSPNASKLAAQELKRLITKNVDLEFTYNHNDIQKTPLMLSIKNKKTMFELLLNEKVNINNCNSYSLTALKFATEWRIRSSYYKKLLAHPDIIINQQNRHGESTLLHCLINRKKFRITNTLIRTIQDLLDADADPELANKYGLTPLAAAQQLGNRRIITIIQQAISRKQALIQ